MFINAIQNASTHAISSIEIMQVLLFLLLSVLERHPLLKATPILCDEITSNFPICNINAFYVSISFPFTIVPNSRFLFSLVECFDFCFHGIH